MAKRSRPRIHPGGGAPPPPSKPDPRTRLPLPGTVFPVRHYGPEDRQQFQFYFGKGEYGVKKPVLCWAYGGSFVAGSMATVDPAVLEPIKSCWEAGISICKFNYGLWPTYRYPTPENDYKRLIQYLRFNHEKFGILGGENGKIAAGGDSAGSLLAGHALYGAELQNGSSADPVERMRSRPRCWVNWRALADWSDFDDTYPDTHFNAPPATQTIAISGATYDHDTLSITSVGAFADFEFFVGARVVGLTVTGGTPGNYNVASKEDDDTITLATSPGVGADGQTDLAGTLRGIVGINGANLLNPLSAVDSEDLDADSIIDMIAAGAPKSPLIMLYDFGGSGTTPLTDFHDPYSSDVLADPATGALKSLPSAHRQIILYDSVNPDAGDGATVLAFLQDVLY